MNKKSGNLFEKVRSFIKSGKLLPALCSVVGTSLIILVILTALPLSIPRVLRYEVYDIITGSMEPEIPVGSVVYAKYVSPQLVETGDIIVYRNAESIITHRVVRNQTVEGQFVTKGDANKNQDPVPVPYSDYIGRVEHHFPAVGRFLSIYSSMVGKFYAFMVAASGVMFNLLAGRLRYALARKNKEAGQDDLSEEKQISEDLNENAVAEKLDDTYTENRSAADTGQEEEKQKPESSDHRKGFLSDLFYYPSKGEHDDEPSEKVRKKLFDFGNSTEDDRETEESEEDRIRSRRRDRNQRRTVLTEQKKEPEQDIINEPVQEEDKTKDNTVFSATEDTARREKDSSVSAAGTDEKISASRSIMEIEEALKKVSEIRKNLGVLPVSEQKVQEPKRLEVKENSVPAPVSDPAENDKAVAEEDIVKEDTAVSPVDPAGKSDEIVLEDFGFFGSTVDK